MKCICNILRVDSVIVCVIESNKAGLRGEGAQECCLTRAIVWSSLCLSVQ